MNMTNIRYICKGCGVWVADKIKYDGGEKVVIPHPCKSPSSELRSSHPALTPRP